ncbi:MAG: hypothetical protein JWL70_1481 [Acidimicrobiia bacterium]|nr:hypothetical protein [Acidimicrobiia bacterium]
MDLELSQDQELLSESVAGIFRRQAGLERAREMNGTLDRPLLDALRDGGYLDVGLDAGPIEAVLVAEAATEAVACAPIATRVIVAGLLGIKDLPPVIGLVASPRSLVRYATDADAFLVLDGDEAKLVLAGDAEVEPVASISGYPLGRVQVRGGTSLGPASGDALRRAWQVAIGVEIGANTLAAVEFSANHVRERKQFGRPIGSFQAVQHRLARSYAQAQATRWLSRRAAWFADNEFVTASAAAFGCLTAETAYTNVHQVTGAIGITTEYGLVQWTTRLLTLQRELGGRRSHAQRVAAARAAELAATAG